MRNVVMKKIFLIAVFVLGFVAQGWGADYYVRADGTAVNKAAATSPSAASTSMSATVFNNETFAAGDFIYFSALGGDYTTVETLNSVSAALHIPSSGSSGSIITYSGITGDEPTIDLTGAASGHCIDVLSADYAVIQNFQIKGDGSNGAFVIRGTTGTAGDGYNVTVRDVDVLSNTTGVTGGDGFDLNDTAEVLFYDITATDCKSSDGGSDQAISFHISAKGKVYGATFSDCNYAYVGTGATEAYFEDITVSGMTLKTFEASGDSTGSMRVTQSIINVDAAGGLFGDIAGSTAEYTIDNNTITITGGGANFVRGILNLHNNTINFNTGNTERYYGLNASAVLNIYNNIFNMTAGDNYIFRTDTIGSTLNFYNNIINESFAKVFLYFDDGGGKVSDNVFKNMDDFTSVVMVKDDSGYNVTITGNTLLNDSSGGDFLDFNWDGDEGETAIMKNNIFENVADVINNAGGTIGIDYNCYFNSEDAGGANSSTADPELTSTGKLQSTSPCIDAGTWITGTNKEGQIDPWGKYIHRLPNIGADQGAGAPKGGSRSNRIGGGSGMGL